MDRHGITTSSALQDLQATLDQLAKRPDRLTRRLTAIERRLGTLERWRLEETASLMEGSTACESRETSTRDLDRILTALRNRIRECGLTQLEVQEALGWGRSYISQLLTKQKTLRIEQILLILNVIGLDPAEFWAEVYQFGQFGEVQETRPSHSAPALFDALDDDDSMLTQARRIQSLLKALVTVLAEKNLITTGEFDAAVERFRRQGR